MGLWMDSDFGHIFHVHPQKEELKFELGQQEGSPPLNE